jgi:uridine kinase
VPSTPEPPVRTLAEIAALVPGTAPRLGPVRLVVVDGPSGSGKTVLAGELAGLLSARGWRTLTVGTDLLATWENPLGWWAELEAGLLKPFSRGEPSALATHDWSTGVPLPGPVLVAAPPQVLVLEGVSAGRRAIADRLSFLIWVDVPDAAHRLERAVARDGEALREEFRKWQLDEDAHYSIDPTWSRADATVRPEG